MYSQKSVLNGRIFCLFGKSLPKTAFFLAFRHKNWYDSFYERGFTGCSPACKPVVNSFQKENGNVRKNLRPQHGKRLQAGRAGPLWKRGASGASACAGDVCRQPHAGHPDYRGLQLTGPAGLAPPERDAGGRHRHAGAAVYHRPGRRQTPDRHGHQFRLHRHQQQHYLDDGRRGVGLRDADGGKPGRRPAGSGAGALYQTHPQIFPVGRHRHRRFVDRPFADFGRHLILCRRQRGRGLRVDPEHGGRRGCPHRHHNLQTLHQRGYQQLGDPLRHYRRLHCLRHYGAVPSHHLC